MITSVEMADQQWAAELYQDRELHAFFGAFGADITLAILMRLTGPVLPLDCRLGSGTVFCAGHRVRYRAAGDVDYL